MRRRRLILALVLGILLTGTAIYSVPRYIIGTPLSNSSSEPRSLSDLVNFTKISSLKESTLTPLSPDWESALATIQQYPGTAPVYAEACARYSCPGGVPVALSNMSQTLLPQKPSPNTNDHFGFTAATIGDTILIATAPLDFDTGTPVGNGAVLQFDSNGNLLTTYLEPVPIPGDEFAETLATIGNNVLIGAPNATVAGINSAGLVYLFDSKASLIRTFQEPTPTTNSGFSFPVAGAGGNVLIGAQTAPVGGLSSAGAAYLFNTNGNLLVTYHEPTPGANDFFGRGIGAGGNVLISAFNATVAGVSGAGAAYLFDSSGKLLATFHEPTPALNDWFGNALSYAGGNILIAARRTTVNGLIRAGAVYVFDTSGNLLRTLHEPTPAAQDQFGFSVASAGSNIIVGAIGTNVGGVASGAAYLFDSNGNLLATFREPIPGALDDFGGKVASVGVNVLVTANTATAGGFSQAGTAYLFDSTGNLLKSLQETVRSINGGSYGFSVAGVGNNLIVGDPFDSNIVGAVYLLDSNGNILRTLTKAGPASSDLFGWAVAGVGPNILVGAPREHSIAAGAGAAYLYDTSGNLLATLRKPAPSANDLFGRSVAALGSNILIAAPGNSTGGFANAGAVYLFDSAGNLLGSFHEPTPAAQDFFGASIANIGGNILVGARQTAVSGVPSAGAAYLFDTKGNLLATFHEPTPGFQDQFGRFAASAGGNILIGAYNSTVNGLAGAGAAYLFSTTGTLLKTITEPTPAAGDGFGYTFTGAAGVIVIGSPSTNGGAGAAYVYDSNLNLLKTLREPAPAAGDLFGAAIMGIGSNILIGSPNTQSAGLFTGAAYYYRQFALRDACAAATGTDCVVQNETGSFQAGPSTVPMSVVAVSLRSARNATLGTQMALTVMCNKEVTDARIACSALYIDGNVWGPARDALTRSPFIIVNAQSYFFLQWHWYDPFNQRIVPWSYWWYGTSVSPNWYWSIYVWWRTYTANNLGVWTPWWWWWWHWTYYLYWNFWTTGLPAS